MNYKDFNPPMKTFKGTPAPWKVTFSPAITEDQVTDSYAIETDSFIIANTVSASTEEEANAKAISQVPAMIEALQHSLRVAKTLPNKDSIGVKMLIKNLEQTLNKAL